MILLNLYFQAWVLKRELNNILVTNHRPKVAMLTSFWKFELYKPANANLNFFIALRKIVLLIYSR